MTDLELHDWALARYGNEDLANKLAIVSQLHRDDDGIDPGTVLYLLDLPPRPEFPCSTAASEWIGTNAVA